MGSDEKRSSRRGHTRLAVSDFPSPFLVEAHQPVETGRRPIHTTPATTSDSGAEGQSPSLQLESLFVACALVVGVGPSAAVPEPDYREGGSRGLCATIGRGGVKSWRIATGGGSDSFCATRVVQVRRSSGSQPAPGLAASRANQTPRGEGFSANVRRVPSGLLWDPRGWDSPEQATDVQGCREGWIVGSWNLEACGCR